MRLLGPPSRQSMLAATSGRLTLFLIRSHPAFLSRRKGEITPRTIDDRWPYQVEFPADPFDQLRHSAGCGIALDAQKRRAGCITDERTRTCFQTREQAEAFQRWVRGGTLICVRRSAQR